MKKDDNLVSNSKVMTLGYHKKRCIIDESFILTLKNYTHLIAELVVEASINPKMLGAIGDGVADDSKYITKCFEYCNDTKALLYMDNFRYLTNESSKIKRDYFQLDCKGYIPIMERIPF